MMRECYLKLKCFKSDVHTAHEYLGIDEIQKVFLSTEFFMSNALNTTLTVTTMTAMLNETLFIISADLC